MPKLIAVLLNLDFQGTTNRRPRTNSQKMGIPPHIKPISSHTSFWRLSPKVQFPCVSPTVRSQSKSGACLEFFWLLLRNLFCIVHYSSAPLTALPVLRLLSCDRTRRRYLFGCPNPTVLAPAANIFGIRIVVCGWPAKFHYCAIFIPALDCWSDIRLDFKLSLTFTRACSVWIIPYAR